jgi:hypothetical protein
MIPERKEQEILDSFITNTLLGKRESIWNVLPASFGNNGW